MKDWSEDVTQIMWSWLRWAVRHPQCSGNIVMWNATMQPVEQALWTCNVWDIRWSCWWAGCEVNIIETFLEVLFCISKMSDDDRVVNSFKSSATTKRRFLPFENHSSKHSREKRRKWRRRRGTIRGRREEREEEEEEGDSGRVWKTATGAPTTNKLKATSSNQTFITVMSALQQTTFQAISVSQTNLQCWNHKSFARVVAHYVIPFNWCRVVIKLSPNYLSQSFSHLNVPIK